jgi:hypothetical protein
MRKGWQAICSQVWSQEHRQQAAVSVSYKYAESEVDRSRERTVLCGVVDALAWRHVNETSMDPKFKRPGQRMVVYPRFMVKLPEVLATKNVGAEPKSSRWPTYERILAQTDTWPQSCPPKMTRRSLKSPNWRHKFGLGWRMDQKAAQHNNNNNIYLVWPQRGTWLHRTTARRAGCVGVHVKYQTVSVDTLCH